MWYFMEKNPVYFLQKNAGTWRMNSFVPDVSAAYNQPYIGCPPRLDNLVALLFAEEGCRMWDARKEERGKFFLSKNAADLGRTGRGRGWL